MREALSSSPTVATSCSSTRRAAAHAARRTGWLATTRASVHCSPSRAVEAWRSPTRSVAQTAGHHCCHHLRRARHANLARSSDGGLLMQTAVVRQAQKLNLKPSLPSCISPLVFLWSVAYLATCVSLVGRISHTRHLTSCSVPCRWQPLRSSSTFSRTSRRIVKHGKLFRVTTPRSQRR